MCSPHGVLAQIHRWIPRPDQTDLDKPLLTVHLDDAIPQFNGIPYTLRWRDISLCPGDSPSLECRDPSNFYCPSCSCVKIATYKGGPKDATWLLVWTKNSPTPPMVALLKVRIMQPLHYIF